MSSAATIQAAAATMRASSASWNSSVEARSTIHSAVSVAAIPISRSSTLKPSAARSTATSSSQAQTSTVKCLISAPTRSECGKRAAIRSRAVRVHPRSSQEAANTTATSPSCKAKARSSAGEKKSRAQLSQSATGAQS